MRRRRPLRVHAATSTTLPCYVTRQGQPDVPPAEVFAGDDQGLINSGLTGPEGFYRDELRGRYPKLRRMTQSQLTAISRNQAAAMGLSNLLGVGALEKRARLRVRSWLTSMVKTACPAGMQSRTYMTAQEPTAPGSR